MVIKVKKDGQYVKIPYLSTDVAVGEAPADGKQYARQDKAWSEVIIPDVDLTDVNAAIAANTAAIGTKVDKVAGKQLSTNDYTTSEKTKLTNIPTPDSIVTTNDNRLTVATPSKAGIMSAADKAQLDSTLTSTEIDSRLAAAVSSVYRVKGSKATLADLPTTDVAVGDVWNIEDTGANYVAINSDPIEWDKLRETVDLTPYMLTSTANSAFVKKDGSTPFINEQDLVKDGSITLRFKDSTDSILRGWIGKIILEGNPVKDGMWFKNVISNRALLLRDTGEITYDDDKIWHSGNDSSLAKITKPSPNDLNTVTKSGFVVNPTDQVAINGINYPIREAGGLISIESAYSRANQIYGSYETNKWFARGSGETANTSWREFAFKDDTPVLTQAEYDALGDTVNSNGKIYFIKE